MKIAIIPARGGSKRIKKKNIKPFLGKPIIAYGIESAIKSGLFDKVMVSTDSVEIANIAKQYGADVPFMRSLKNSDDHATTVDVLIEVIEAYIQRGENIEEACCIYATAPFVSTNDLQKTYQLLIDEQFDVVFPVLQYSFPIQRALKLDNNRMKMFHPELKTTRSQDLEKSYHDSGQFYWFKTLQVLTKRNLWTDNTGVIVLNEMDAHDIDTEEDWEIAEFKYRLRKND